MEKQVQTTGYILNGQNKIKLLIRSGKTYRTLKVRTTGSDGHHFSDEEIFLADNPEILEKLLAGNTVNL